MQNEREQAAASAGPTAPGEAAPRQGRAAELCFALTLFVSAALLFAVQPMFAKMVLPLLGGAPSVWNTCLVFYQAALLAGYIYAHLSLRWLGPRRQAALHMLLLCLPWLVLPIRVAQGWLPPPDVFPVVWLWMLLSVSVGLPFLLVSASAPMLQAWFAETSSRSARDPYFLYAASNLGSLLALVSYPLLIESQLTLASQAWCWAAGYGLLMVLIAGCAVWLWRDSPLSRRGLRRAQPSGRGVGGEREPAEESSVKEHEHLSWRRRLHWLALALVPSSLLLGVTAHISTDIAAMPLLWVIPLTLYLLSFVLVFARRPLIPLSWALRAQPLLLVAAAATLAAGTMQPLAVVSVGSLHLVAFFVTAMVCHGQLAADRPSSSRLTEFYLWMSLGGVLGGLLNALVAPLLFSRVWEYPLMMAAACLLRPRGTVPIFRGASDVTSAIDVLAAKNGTVPLVAQNRTGPFFGSHAPDQRRLTTEKWTNPRFREWALPAALLLLCGGLTFALRSEALLASRYANAPASKLAVVLVAAVAALLLRRRPATLAAGVAGLLAVTFWSAQGAAHVLHVERSFFGVLRVDHDRLLDAHGLMHGSTAHGLQSCDASQRREPWGYFHRQGPLGRIFQSLATRRPLRQIGVLGLGTGAIAAYGEPGERITYYEIDPAVERIARDPDYFTYLADCRAQVEVILGDGRLLLTHGPPRQFDLLVIDAFSSDIPPVHLITREALQIYLERLAPRGLLVFDVTNRYLNLQPVLGALAEDAGLAARVCEDDDPMQGDTLGKLPSHWVVMARRPEDLGPLAEDPRWAPLPSGGRVWTDDFSHVVGALRWQWSWQWLRPSTWWGSEKASDHVAVGFALLRQGKLAEAIDHYRKALEIDPNDAQAHNNLGSALGQQGKFDEAVAEYQKALEIDPKQAKVLYNLGNLYVQQRRLNEAVAHYQQALAIDPQYDEACNSLGTVLFEQGKVFEAMAYYQKTLQINPRSADAHYNLGNALFKLGNLAEAIAQYQRALRIEPNHALTHHILGVILCEQGRPAEAIGHLQDALKGNPDFAETRRYLGDALYQQGKVAEALAQWREAIGLQPDPTAVLNRTALVLATRAEPTTSELAEAVKLAERAVELSGGRDPAMLDTLAVAYAASGRFDDAIATAQKGLELAIAARQSVLANGIQMRLQLYRAGQPYRRPPRL